MIVPMTEFSMLIFHSEYDAFLPELKKMGVFHVAEKNKGEDAEQKANSQMMTEIDNAIAFLVAHKPEKKFFITMGN